MSALTDSQGYHIFLHFHLYNVLKNTSIAIQQAASIILSKEKIIKGLRDPSILSKTHTTQTQQDLSG